MSGMIYKPRNVAEILGGEFNKTERMNPAEALAQLQAKARTAGTKRNSPEADAQAELFAWKERNVNRIPSLRWLHSSGNGYNLSTPAARAQANRTGRVRGIWDVFLPVCRAKPPYETPYSGFYIEMKAPGERKKGNGGLTTEQQDFRNDRCGVYYFVVCYSSAEAIAAICSYLGVEDPEGGK